MAIQIAGVLLPIPLAVLLARRYSGPWWVATVVTAAVGLWAVVHVPETASLPSFAMLAAAWGAATAVDIAEHRLPDPLTLIPVPLFYVLLLTPVIIESGWGRMFTALLGSLLTATILFILAYINPNGFGLGDVKLGLTTGAALGWFGLGTALLGLGAAFILMALVGGLLLATKRITLDSEIAFGPFMVLGVLVAPGAASLLGA